MWPRVWRLCLFVCLLPVLSPLSPKVMDEMMVAIEAAIILLLLLLGGNDYAISTRVFCGTEQQTREPASDGDEVERLYRVFSE